VFLDAETKTMIATGDPKMLLAECEDPRVRRFLTRGEDSGAQGAAGKPSMAQS
jgi:phospholipid/cholesterol/gamma-HCH transport system ATP-binding protein